MHVFFPNIKRRPIDTNHISLIALSSRKSVIVLEIQKSISFALGHKLKNNSSELKGGTNVAFEYAINSL